MEVVGEKFANHKSGWLELGSEGRGCQEVYLPSDVTSRLTNRCTKILGFK